MKRVYSVEGRMIIAESKLQAAVIYRENFGDERRKLRVKRQTSGFTLSYDGEPPFECDEAEFIRLVDTYGGGVVQEE